MEYFEENTEAIFFESADELKDKLVFLENNPSLAEQIKLNAHIRSKRSGYSYDERSKQVLDIFKEFLK